MSLVQAIITDDFALVGADSRGTAPNGDIYDNVNKIIKINNNIIFGCTGGTQDNNQMFGEVCNFSKENGFSMNDGYNNITYHEFAKYVTSRFKIMYDAKHRQENSIPYEIMSIICGYNGERVLKEYCLILIAVLL